MFWNKEKEPKKDFVVIRGIKIKVTGFIRIQELPTLYLVFKALEGDQLAKDILDAFGKIVNDADGNQIYPPKG